VSVAPVTGVLAARTALVDTGYTFTNWTNEDGDIVSVNPVFFPSKTGGLWVTDTYTANFTAKTIRVYVDPNGGTSPLPAQIDVAFASAYGSLPATTRAGYAFDGWWTTKAGGTLITALTSVTDATDPQTLFAHWTENIYPVIKHFGLYSGSGTSFARIDFEDYTQFDSLISNETDLPVDPANYSVSYGSTVITLTEAYTQTYPVGTYYFTALFENGKTDPIWLQIQETGDGGGGGDGGDGGGDGGGTGGGNGNGSGNGDLPITGDNWTFWLVVFAVFLTVDGMLLLLPFSRSGRPRQPRGTHARL
jgi:uncharacterized repeat protein (TIGR02543 family)